MTRPLNELGALRRIGQNAQPNEEGIILVCCISCKAALFETKDRPKHVFISRHWPGIAVILFSVYAVPHLCWKCSINAEFDRLSALNAEAKAALQTLPQPIFEEIWNHVGFDPLQ
jgi:hypothetical protein